MQCLRNSLSEPTRLAIIQDLIGQIKAEHDTSALSLCLSLLDQQQEQTLTVVNIILEDIDHFDIDEIIQILERITEATEAAEDAISDRLLTITALEPPTDESRTTLDEEQQIIKLLTLARRLVSSHLSSSTIDKLLTASLKHLQSLSQKVAHLAKDVCFSIFPLIITTADLLERLHEVLTQLFMDPAQHTIAYAMWLRLALSWPSHLFVEHMTSRNYWYFVAEGLREGDSERQKLCMEILRQSVAVAVKEKQPNLVSPVQGADMTTIVSQYARFLTIFENIVHSRSGSRIIESESSLRLLTSTASVLDTRWPYLMLGVALHDKITNQTRRYYGQWIISGNMASDYCKPQFLELLCDTALDWMTEGHLYTATLILSASGTYRSRHGEQVSRFIDNLFTAQVSLEAFNATADMILTFLNSRHDLFDFAVAYILDGWTRAQTRSARTFTSEQVAAILTLSDRKRPTHAAKRFIGYCCWRLTGNRKAQKITIGEIINGAYSAADAQSILSQRDYRILETSEKCKALGASIDSVPLDVIISQLHEIWNDVEYFETPRDLMLILPQTYLSEKLIDIVVSGKDSTGGLRRVINTTLVHLLKQVQTKSYLILPLMTTLRTTILALPKAVDVIDLSNVILHVADSPPEPRTEFQLEYTALRLLFKLQKDTDPEHEAQPLTAYEGVGFAAYFDLINRLGQHQDLLKSIIDSITSRWLRQKVPAPSISAFKASLQLQVLVLCCEQLNDTIAESYIGQLLQDLFRLLSIEPLPRYRYLLSWTILRLLARFPVHRKEVLHLLGTHDHHSNPKYIAALMKLSVDLLQIDDIGQQFANHLANAFVALSASSKIIVRHEAQWSFPILMDEARARGWSDLSENPAHVALDRYIRSLPRFGDPPKERTQSAFDPSHQNTMTNLTEGLWTDLDYDKPPYTRRAHFLTLYDQDCQQGLVGTDRYSCLSLGEAVDRVAEETETEDDFEEPSILGPQRMNQEQAIALQTKGTAYLRALLGDIKSTKPSTLIVIASLLDNHHNLGGLSRVSEIFGAQTLYMRDTRVIAEKNFTSVSVSSHNHIDIMPLAIEDMPEFLAARRKEGWSVIGIEQTDRSVMLGGQDSLPSKSILIIGNERIGMPGSVISECDVLIEIPQKGVTRSMNVQTAAAVVLYEYNRQHSTTE